MYLNYLHSIREFELDKILPDLRPVSMPNKGCIKVLEIGAGTGHQAKRLHHKGFDVIAIDLPQSFYSSQREFPIIEYDGLCIPLKDDCIDVVFSSNVLEHVPKLKELLAEIRRVLVPGGTALHILPTPTWRRWNTFAHIPWVIKRSIQLLFGGRLNTYSSDKQDRIVRSNHWYRSLLPSRHGVRGNLFSESMYFSSKWWISVFMEANYSTIKSYPIGLFYSGTMLAGTALSIKARKKLANLLGSSCHVYVLNPNKERN